MKIQLFIFFLLTGFYAESQAKKGFQVLITGENDFFAVNNKDENYTGGLKIEVLTPGINTRWLPFYKFTGANSINMQRYAVAGVAYTPQNLASKEIVYGDRPYASLVYFSFGNTSFNINRKMMVQSELIVGNMGGKGPGVAQAYIHGHHWFGSTRDVPKGWDNQVGHKHTFTVNYNSRVQFQICQIKTKKDRFTWLQLHGAVSVDIGNYMTNLQFGPKINFINHNLGILQENIPDIPVTIAATPGNATSVSSTKKRCFRFNFFVEPHIRIVAYNATLEGRLFNDHSVYKIAHSDVKRFLPELNAGFNLVLGDCLSIRYSFYGRGREYSNGKSFHSWGSVSVGISPGRWNHG